MISQTVHSKRPEEIRVFEETHADGKSDTMVDLGGVCLKCLVRADLGVWVATERIRDIDRINRKIFEIVGYEGECDYTSGVVSVDQLNSPLPERVSVEVPLAA